MAACDAVTNKKYLRVPFLDNDKVTMEAENTAYWHHGECAGMRSFTSLELDLNNSQFMDHDRGDSRERNPGGRRFVVRLE